MVLNRMSPFPPVAHAADAPPSLHTDRAMIPWICAVYAAAAMAGGAHEDTGTRHRIEREAYVMGTAARVAVSACSRASALDAAESALGALEATEALLSTWDPSTPLSRLNASPDGHAFPVPAPLLRLLAEAARWSDRTAGAFDPSVGPLVDAWDLRGAGRVPSDTEIAEALGAVGMAGFRIDSVAWTVTRPRASAWIDTGAFGKGVGLREAAGVLRARGVEDAVLDLGGQLMVVGAGSLLVGVAHPVDRTCSVARLRLRDASVATSGSSERGGHILDPRTGRPVPPWGSVTVVAPDALVADVLSTALYVMGPRAGMAWVEALDSGEAPYSGQVAVLFQEMSDGRVVPTWNAAMEGLFETAPAQTAGGSNSIDESKKEPITCSA